MDIRLMYTDEHKPIMFIGVTSQMNISYIHRANKHKALCSTLMFVGYDIG
jgi:hypothetical protein